MKMFPSRLRLLQLLLFACSLQRRSHGLWQCPGNNHVPTTQWEKEAIMEQADTFFDVDVCGPDGLQWACLVRRENFQYGLDRSDEFIKATNTDLNLKNFPAVFAIQTHTINQWRIVMQANDVDKGKKLIFKANCLDEFECWSDDGVTVKGSSRRNGFFTNPSEQRGRYDGRRLMCDFVITSARNTEIVMEDSKYTGFVTPNGKGEARALSSYFIDEAVKRHKEKGCQLSMVRTLPKASAEEEYKAVSIDYRNFTCPANYTMRWRDTVYVSDNPSPFFTTPGIFCKNKLIKVVHDGVADSRTAQLDVHCMRKKCKLCKAPSCANSAACPEMIPSDDFDTCTQLKCKDEQHLLKVGGQLHPGNAKCTGVKWLVGDAEVQNVECAKVSCPNVHETIKPKDAEKFIITDDRVVCKDVTEDIKYTDSEDKGRMTAIVCNYSIGGSWYEERKEPDLAPGPYKDGTIDCYAQESPPPQPATGNVLLFTGIGLGVLAAIIGVMLAICFFMRREKKKKARAAALKKATKGSKSKESKLLSPTGSKSTMSRVTSTRSVTGNNKKKTGGKTPDDITPEERSRPVNRSSIVATAELKKIEEERRKTAAATAALLESSKVEDEPQPVPATGAGSGEVPVEMIGKGSASLIPDATQQPETVEPPKLKGLQKKRMKKSKILENTDLTQQPTMTVDKTQMPTASTQAVPSMAVSKTQLGGPESDDEPEQPMWHNQPAAIPATAAVTADKKEDAAPAAAVSDRQKIADLPTAKKKESSKKRKSGKRTPSAEKVVRPNFLNDTSDWEKDFTSEKKKAGGSNEEGGGSKESEKDERSKRTQQRAWARKTSKRLDPTQHIPRAGSDSAEGENN